ncbi:MAG: ABC transporter substrate-binding protein [Armatimonadota bacterium]|nr:ABC transporter substrate-binding protein [Armatimonadota bacterium]MDR5696430.1 ABC transporter substrate-binding protein [Armatimonadota bacterium]
MARLLWIAVFIAALLAAPVTAQVGAIRIGVVVDITGPASSLGVPERNTVQLYENDLGFAQIPRGRVPIRWVVTDGESDVTKTVVAVRRFIEEERVAAVVCCTTSPASLAIIGTVQSVGIPNISLAAAATIVEPVRERFWVFKTPQTDRMMIDVLTDHMRRLRISRIAFLGFDDAFGQGGAVELDRLAPAKNIEVVAKEFFARTATDVSAQIVRAMGRNPQAILIWAIPPGANVASKNIRDLGIRLPVYHSHGVANKTFLDLGGPNVEGVYLPAGKVLVAEQLNVNDPQRPVLLEYVRRYESRFGPGTRNTFGGHALDAMLILKPAIERALRRGVDPGNVAAFRRAIRDEIETNTKELIGITGVFNFSPEDHLGLDKQRAAVMLQVRRGNWAWLR